MKPLLGPPPPCSWQVRRGHPGRWSVRIALRDINRGVDLPLETSSVYE